MRPHVPLLRVSDYPGVRFHFSPVENLWMLGDEIFTASSRIDDEVENTAKPARLAHHLYLYLWYAPSGIIEPLASDNLSVSRIGVGGALVEAFDDERVCQQSVSELVCFQRCLKAL